MSRRHIRTQLLTSSVALLALTACGGDDNETAPTIVSFSSSATSVDEGQAVTLSWTVDDATTIALEQGSEVLVASAPATDTYNTEPLTADTTFTLRATNDAGEVTRSVTVTVNADVPDAPEVNSFMADPATIEPGGSTTLSWETTNAVAVDIMEGNTMVVTDGDADGSTTVSPAATTTYTLVAKAGDGQTAMSMVTVTVNAPAGPMVVSFTANPSTIDEGDSSTLSWNVNDADTIEIVDGDNNSVYSGSDAMGTQSVTPAATTTYTLTATNPNGTDSQTVMVTVNVPQLPTIDGFTANPGTVMLGQSSDLSWMVQNADTIEIQAGGATLNTSTMGNGTFTVTPTASTDYTLVATNAVGTQMAMATVTVNASAPIVNDFSAAPNPLAVGSTVTLSWDVLGADTVRVLEGTTELANTTMNMGTVDVTVTSTLTTYTLEAANTTGGNTAQVMVYGHEAAVINTFTATPMSFVSGATATVTLSWDAANVQNLSIQMNGMALPGFTPIANTNATTDEVGTFDVVISADTTFTLMVDSQAGTDMATVSVLGSVVEVEPNNTATAAVSLSGAPVLGTIGVGSGDEDWFAIMVPAGGWVDAETGDGMGGCNFDTRLDLYAPDGTTLIESNDDGGAGTCSHIDPRVDPGARNLAAGVYYVRVYPFNSSAGGDYQLDATAGGPLCGNEIPETGEACDDGNNVNGDGCDSACNFEPVNVYAAPGAPATFADAINPAGEQDIYRVDVTGAAILTVETFVDATAGTCAGADTVIYLLDASGNVLGSDDQGGVSSCSRIDPATDSFAQLSAGTYYVLVEDFLNDDTIPAYEIVFESIAGNVCGNGFIEPGNSEVCDDGNTVAGDGCDANCQPEFILDYTAPGPVATASSAITVATQVDSVRITATATVYIGAETLEDAVAGTCDTIDTRLRLRDSTGVELGSDDFDGVGSCSQINPNNDAWARVGPGVYFLTIEEDGQNATISSYTVGVVGLPVDICGNGVLEAGLSEQCDDGNTTSGDGCSATCQFEPVAVHTAPGAPTTVTAQSLAVGEQQLYQITVNAEAWVDVQTYTDITTQACSGPDLFMRLLDSTFAELQTDDDGGVGLCSAFNAGTDGFTRLMPGTYYVIVEELGRNAAVPSYDIEITSFAVDVCGNGIVDGAGEVCDDGNTANGDGCSSTCQLEGNIFSEVEPNGSIATANDPGLIALGFVTATGVVDLGNDQDFYVFTVPAGGADFNARTYTQAGDPTVCVSDTEVFLYDAAGTELANDDDGGPGLCSNLTVTGLTAGTYYISVEYYSRNFDPSSPFPYFVDITLQ